MRLIDADELKRLGYVLTRTYPKDPQTMVYETKNIDNIPTIDPIRHGRWVYDEERGATGIYAICTSCNEKIYQTGEFKYCPNCGANME